MELNKKTTECLQSIQKQLNSIKNDDSAKFDEILFLEKLKEAEAILNDSLRILRPADLPEDLAWNEKPYNPDEDFDPFVYDGSLSPEDFKKVQEQFLQDLD